jgi:Zn-dependent protease
MNIDSNTVNIIVFFAALLFSVSLHEMMHAYVALKLGDDLAHSHGRISLNPFNHIDPFLTLALPTVLYILGLPIILAAKPVPINTNRISGDEIGLAAVGLAGPLTNLALATITALFINLTSVSGAALDAAMIMLMLNIGLFVFNMIPIPPLDGSRLVYAFAPRSVQRVMEQIEGFGIFAVLIILWLLLPVLSPIITSVQRFLLNILL